MVPPCGDALHHQHFPKQALPFRRYWKFTAGKRWDAQRKKGPYQPEAGAAQPPRLQGAPEQALQAQLAGLKRKAAFRAAARRQQQQQHSVQSMHGAPQQAASVAPVGAALEIAFCAMHNERVRDAEQQHITGC